MMSELQASNVRPVARGHRAQPGMIEYTQHAQQLNQRRYRTNTNASNKHSLRSGGGRKWATLPKLNHAHPGAVTTRDHLTRLDRPQSDMVIHESLSRANSPVRPSSESTGIMDQQFTPYHSRLYTRDYVNHYKRGRHNILTLCNDEQQTQLYNIQETPVQSAIKNVNQANRSIEIVPFPGVVPFNAQPAIIHRNSKQKICNLNEIHKTKPVKVAVNKSMMESVAKYTNRKPAIPRQTKPQYSKQMSQSSFHAIVDTILSSSSSSSMSSSIEDFSEIIVPAIEKIEVSDIRTPAADTSKQKILIKDLVAAKVKHTEALLKPQTFQKNSPRTKNEKLTTDTVKFQTPSYVISKGKKRTEAEQPIAIPHVQTKPHQPAHIAVKGNKVTANPITHQANKETTFDNTTTHQANKETTSANTTTHQANKRTNSANTATHQANKGTTSANTTAHQTRNGSNSAGTNVQLANKVSTASFANTSHQNEQQQEEKILVTCETPIDKANEDTKQHSPIRGVLKPKIVCGNKGRKKNKSVKFGPKIVREVTKITYPWNEESDLESTEDEESQDDSEEQEDDEDSVIEEEIEQVMQTLKE